MAFCLPTKNTAVSPLALGLVLSALPISHFLCFFEAVLIEKNSNRGLSVQSLPSPHGDLFMQRADMLQKVLMDSDNCNTGERLNQGYFGGTIEFYVLDFSTVGHMWNTRCVDNRLLSIDVIWIELYNLCRLLSAGQDSTQG